MSYLALKKTLGFTLVELIAVMVVLSIIGALGSSFLIKTLDMYNNTSEKAALISRGRVSIEQMTRYLRNAVPNSARISSSGKCIEFLPAIAGGNYLNELPDAVNSAAAISSTTTSAFYITTGTARYFIAAPLAASDIYTTTAVSAKASISSLSGTPYTTVNFSSSTTFIRNSVSKRFFIADYPIRFCIANGELLRYSNYGFSNASLNDSDPGGGSDIMADAITTANSSFAVSAASEDINTRITLVLALNKGKTSVTLTHQVVVRNVP